MRPTEARIEELQEPFVDQTDVKRVNNSVDPTLRELELHFDTRGKAETIFGALEPLRFEHPFDLRLVGSRTKLPRGAVDSALMKQKDPNFFRSIHIGGEEKVRIIEEAQQKEKEVRISRMYMSDALVRLMRRCMCRIGRRRW